ncbi:MAG: cation:proton antiporter, partial [Deltaproteobacteria bacterium]|nr:cation:proton antiporter [Deltaproteobacteria bacterium]
MDPIMPIFVGAIAAILLIGILLRRLKQPHVIAYLVAGAALGPFGLSVVEDAVTISRLGEVGVVLLLFFAGMEIQLPKLLASWRVPVLGTLLLIAGSVMVSFAVGWWSDWPIGRSVLVGFVISLSSTGVVMKLLRDRGETDDPVGIDVTGVLLAQDLAVIPMLIAVSLLGGTAPDALTVGSQLVGGAVVIGLLVYVARHDSLRLPFGSLLREDHELQVFSAFLLAFGFALLTGFAGLSVALGAFVAGLVVGAARETEWVTEALHPFYVLLLALFFVSVGMLIDFGFLYRNAAVIGALLVAAFVLNTVITAGILRLLGRTWRNSIYGATLLAQIGEFSFV